MNNERNNDSSAQPDAPQFVFVAKLSKEDRKKAMADAFAKAKANATELAAAAGVELGPLVGLSGYCSGQSSVNENEYDGSPQFGFTTRYRRSMVQQTGEEPGTKPDEAVGSEPDTLNFAACVTASFGLKK